MIVVFWLEEDNMLEHPFKEAHYQSFRSDELSVALKFAEDLRTRRKEYEATIKEHGKYTAPTISHICIQSEMPESVGQSGVAEVTGKYEWHKRRIDPAIKLGRDDQIVDGDDDDM